MNLYCIATIKDGRPNHKNKYKDVSHEQLKHYGRFNEVEI